MFVDVSSGGPSVVSESEALHFERMSVATIRSIERTLKGLLCIDLSSEKDY